MYSCSRRHTKCDSVEPGLFHVLLVVEEIGHVSIVKSGIR